MSLEKMAGVFVLLAMGVGVSVILIVGEAMVASCRESAVSASKVRWGDRMMNPNSKVVALLCYPYIYE